MGGQGCDERSAAVTTIVRVITSEHPAAVMAYPREGGDPVPGAEYTELAQVPAHSQYDTVVHAGQDVLVVEMPLPAEAVAAPEREAA